VKIVGCEFSKYVQLLENRQRKVRRYKQADIKPLLTVVETNITSNEIEINEEQIQKNCEEIQELIKQNPKSTISVLRIDIDRCQIKEKGTRKVLYEGNTEETLIKLKEMLTTVAQENIAKETVEEIQFLELPSDVESKEILRSLGYDI